MGMAHRIKHCKCTLHNNKEHRVFGSMHSLQAHNLLSFCIFQPLRFFRTHRYRTLQALRSHTDFFSQQCWQVAVCRQLEIDYMIHTCRTEFSLRACSEEQQSLTCWQVHQTHSLHHQHRYVLSIEYAYSVCALAVTIVYVANSCVGVNAFLAPEKMPFVFLGPRCERYVKEKNFKPLRAALFHTAITFRTVTAYVTSPSSDCTISMPCCSNY